MQNILTPEEIFQLVTTGMVNLTDDLIIRLAESSRDAHHNLVEMRTQSRRDAHT